MKSDQHTAKETTKRMDGALKRALNMAPILHKESSGKKKDKKKRPNQ